MSVDLKATASLDTRQYEAGIRRMKGVTQGFSQGVRGGGVGGGGGVGLLGMLPGIGMAVTMIQTARAAAAWATSSMALGSALQDQADAAGLSTEQMQRWNAAALQAGKSPDVIVTAMARIRDAQGGVIGGQKEMIRAFDALGISQEQVASMRPDELFRSVAQAFSQAKGEATAYSAAADILGSRAMPQLISIMEQIGSGTEMAAEKTKIMSDTTVVALDRMSDAWERFKQNVKVGLAEAFVATVDFFRGSDSMLTELIAREDRAAQQQRAAEMGRAANEAELEKRKAEEAAKVIQKREQGLADIAGRAKAGAIISDSYSKVGGMMGGAADPALRLEQRQATILEESAKYLAKIEKNTENKTATAGD
jgi:hypothetical protein